MTTRIFLPFLFLVLLSTCLRAQDSTAVANRFAQIEASLDQLAQEVPGLSNKVDFGVSGVSIQEFLRGLAETNDLNISIDPSLNFKVYNSFKNERVKNILLFLVREYAIDIRFIGSIISIMPYTPPVKPVLKVVPQAKDLIMTYNTYTEKINFDLQNDSLERVAKRIAQLTKHNIALSPGLRNKVVSSYVEELPLENALGKLAFSNNLLVGRSDDGSYLLTEESKEQAQNTKTGSSRGLQTTFPNNKREEGGIRVKDSLQRKFISVTAANMPIADVVQAAADQMGISYFTFSELKGNTTNFTKDLSFDDFLSLLFQGTDYTFRVEKGIYLIGDRKLEGLRTYKLVQLQYRSLESILEQIPVELKKGVELKEFKELNSILLSGAAASIREIEAFIRELDKTVPMVIIEVILMDIRKGNTIKTGIKAGISDSVKSAGSVLPGIDFTLGAKSINRFLESIGTNNVFNLGKVSPKFYISLSALEQNNNVEVRSVPKLSTLNGHDANLTIGSTRYYSTTTQNVLGSLNPQTVVTQQFTPVQANLSINIKPIVSGDEQVTLNIDVNISDFIGDVPNNAPPPSSTSQFKSMMRVKNEEMLVLGGLERVETSDNGSGTPFLSRVPVIKWFFSSRSRTKGKIVSVVFIKPTIVY